MAEADHQQEGGSRQLSSENPADDASGFSPEALEAARKLFSGPVAFALGVVKMAQLPPGDRAEVAFAGRSNVGKSSLLNALLNRKNLARASAEPGRTRELNFFDLAEGRFYLVDLPGYGYAKVSKASVEAWTKLTFSYLRGRPTLKRVFLLIDSRRGVGEVDVGVMKILDQAAVSYQLVLTKTDKLKAGEAASVLAKTIADARKQAAAHPVVLSTSSETGAGLDVLRAEIASLE